MIVLGLDTTGSQCSVSLVDDASVRAHICRDIGRGHAEVLADMVADAFTAADLTPLDVGRLAVCTGPGSFTGLRVALSFAKGFALPRNLPIIGIDALVLTHMEKNPSGNPPQLVFKDVRRNEVMFGTYSGLQMLHDGRPRLGTMHDARQEAEHFRAATLEVTNVDTRILGWLAIELNPESYPAEPLYSRGPDAKLPGGKSPSKHLAKTKA